MQTNEVAQLIGLAFAASGLFLTALNTFWSRRWNRMKATQDALDRLDSERSLIDELLVAFPDILTHGTRKTLAQISGTFEKHRGIEEKVRAQLNRFEFLAIGVKAKVYDEASVRTHLSSIMHDWFAYFGPYIASLRASRRETYSTAVEMLRRWNYDTSMLTLTMMPPSKTDAIES